MTEHADVAQLEHDLEAELCRRSFYRFAERFWPAVTNLLFPVNTATSASCAALQAVAECRIWRLLWAASPGSGKSTTLVLFSVWRYVRKPDWRSMHAMHAQADANRESNRVRRLLQHADFVALFPYVTLDPSEQDIKSWLTTQGGRYFALGTDAAITSKRVLELVVDDPMNAIDRHSKTSRDEVWTWLDEGAMSRLDGDRAPIIIVAQRLDRDDIHARCLASGEWVILEPAAERDDRGLELRDHAGDLVWKDDRAAGELIAPQMLTREKLAKLSKSVRTTQYQQRPDEDNNSGTIDRIAWRFHAPAGANPNAPRPLHCATPTDSPTVETPDSFDAIVISCDPTFGGTRSSNDFCSIQVWAACGTGRYLVDRWKKRAKQLEQRSQLKAFREKYPDATILIEKTAGGAGMIEELEAEHIDNIEAAIVGSTTGGKAVRLDVVSPTIEQGFAFLPIGMPDLQDFVDELCGKTLNDDDLDACSQGIAWLNRNAGDNTVSLLLRCAANHGTQTAAALAAQHLAEQQRRTDRLTRLVAKEARGEPLSRGEALHLRLARRRAVLDGER